MALSSAFSHSPDERLDWLLQSIAGMIQAEITCLYVHDRILDDFEVASQHWALDDPAQIWPALDHWVRGQFGLLKDDPLILPLPDGSSALLWPLKFWSILIGVLVVIRSGAYQQAEISSLVPPVQIISNVLENGHLTQRLITTEAVANTAQAIARNPSPQNIVHILRDYLFDLHIAACFIGLYGPASPEQPGAPFEYIEIVGSWSRNLGSKVGVGTRFNHARYPDVMRQLESQSFVLFDDISNVDFNTIDPFLRLLVKTDNLKSLTALSLESEQRKLGVLVIMTDRLHEFDIHELQTYRIVTQFLTMSTMATVLQQEADFVQQGRAAVLDAVTDGVVMILPDENYTVLTVNEQFTWLFGLRESAVRGFSLCQLLDKMRLPADVRDQLKTAWRAITPQDATRIQGEFRMAGPTGISTDIQWYSVPVYQEKQVIGRIYTFHDITAERTSERLRSELLSRISHELRTPLTSIRGFAEFILEAVGDELPELAREYTEIILQSAKHLNHLFTDMIEITRANVGKLQLNLSDQPIEALIREVSVRLQAQLHPKNQTVRLYIDPALPLVHIDRERIGQVLGNLINNASKYAPPHTEIAVFASYAPHLQEMPTSTPPNVITPCILIKVIDQGKGLNSEEVEKVFLPFYRAKEAVAGQIEGAGLGLAIAHSIVEMHGGKIWVEPASVDHPGGRFLFTIPSLH